jgi:Protein of unknown function (DUF2934)
MGMPVTEDQIRTLAFYLWEMDGSPDGRSDEYWQKPREQLATDSSTAEPDADSAPTT